MCHFFFKPVRAYDEDLENLFLTVQECVSQIEQNRASDNPRYVEYLYDRLEGQSQIVLAISLVLANSHGYQALNDLLQNLLHFPRELLHELRNKTASLNIDTCSVFQGNSKASGAILSGVTATGNVSLLCRLAS